MATKARTAKSKVLYTRAEPALVRAIKDEQTKRQEQQPGVTLSQADVIRTLLWEAINKAREARTT
jgi:hypothetical protein